MTGRKLRKAISLVKLSTGLRRSAQLPRDTRPSPPDTPRVADTIKLSSPATSDFWDIAVLHEDEHLLALNKPAGLLTSPDRYDPARPNLMKLLHAAIFEGKSWAKQRNLTYLSNAHRLDFDTSGVILMAKDKPVTLIEKAG